MQAKKYSIIFKATGLVWGIPLQEVKRQLRASGMDVPSACTRLQEGEKVETPWSILFLTPAMVALSPVSNG